MIYSSDVEKSSILLNESIKEDASNRKIEYDITLDENWENVDWFYISDTNPKEEI